MQQPPNQPYAPLPYNNNTPYNPYVASSHDDFRPPSTPSLSSRQSSSSLPLQGADAQPRFLNHAAYGGEIRQSIGSVYNSPSQSEFGASSYTLHNDNTPYHDDPNGSRIAMAPLGNSRGGGYGDEPKELKSAYAPPSKRRKLVTWIIIGSIILLIAAVAIPLYFAVIKPRMEASSTGSSSSNGGGGSKGGKPSSGIVTGGDGTKITMENGKTFTYENKFGGTWYWDENDPFNNGARPQSWSPALNETFVAGEHLIRGVNLGGWLVLEPFICPQMFEPHLDKTPTPIDEYHLHMHMTAKELETHYQTFITEQDFAEIAGAGLNYVRIPVPYWMVEKFPGEPWHEKIAWTYFLKAIQWARKYGLRINIDLHTIPGSQNGWDHSGRFGEINWMQGPMGLANAQRSLDIIRVIAEFISQPQYKDVVTMFGVVNEPREFFIGLDQLKAFHYEAYKILRTAGGTGEGNGPWISVHDGFVDRVNWTDFLPGADRLTLDSHTYMAFADQIDEPISFFEKAPCTAWAGLVNASNSAFALSNAGEFSNAVNDCGLWLTGVNQGTRFDGNYAPEPWRTGFGVGACSKWTDWQKYTPETKAGLMRFALSSMDALQNYFFWTWKIGASIRTNKVETPAWSYQLGLENGWMPKDPRLANGACGYTNPQTGPIPKGPSTAPIPPAAVANLVWPPAQFKNYSTPVAELPRYTPTGPIPTLPGPTFPKATPKPDVGDGWANAADQTPMMAPIPGCNYPDTWVGAYAVSPGPCP